MIWPTISPGHEVAHQPLRAGMAERAGQRAADLARDAERAAVLLGDIDGLDFLAVVETEQPFARAVDRDLLGHDLGPRQREALGKLAAQLLGDVGHGGEGGNARGHRASPRAGAPACASAARARRARQAAPQAPTRLSPISGLVARRRLLRGRGEQPESGDMVMISGLAGVIPGPALISCRGRKIPRSVAEKPWT